MIYVDNMAGIRGIYVENGDVFLMDGWNDTE